jgi:hypothetical protein
MADLQNQNNLSLADSPFSSSVVRKVSDLRTSWSLGNYDLISSGFTTNDSSLDILGTS